MKLLLDTHTYLWLLTHPKKVGKRALNLIRSDESQLFVSVVSLAEISIKSKKNKITFDFGAINETLESISGKILELKLHHIKTLDQLDLIHNDPFDRFLIAQAKAEDAILLSGDQTIHRYPCYWAWD
jgi:PIN domain nuclease of toxin-antitoxin system